MNNNALIAMSGGVDSSVAAYLTQLAGFHCVGATMLMCSQELVPQAADPVQDAHAVANKLGMDFHVLDARTLFQTKVVDNFVSSYEAGSTPNPCIVCNKHLKFDYFIVEAQALNCDRIVTGHYAQIKQDHTGKYLLYKAADEAKDQSYFLACIPAHQLARIRFPLGGLTKEQVREIALEQGFINARKRDSQDICFIPDGDYSAFLRRYTGKHYPSGDFLDMSGCVVGKHSGAVDYTLGQRKGLGLAMGAPVYVCGKDMDKNTVTVGPNDALFSDALIASNWNWFCFDSLEAPMRVTAKARSRHLPQPATVYPMDNGHAKVVFDEPQRALTPGQAVVLYEGDMVVGGGTITKVL